VVASHSAVSATLV
jgi:ribonuclease HI